VSSAERATFFEAAAPFTGYASVEAGGATYLVRVEDQTVGRSLFVGRYRKELEVLEQAVLLITALSGEEAIVGRQFVDVGANIGTSTIPALLTHGFGSAVCFEPEPRDLLTLRLNLLVNALEGRATAIGAAVSDSIGTAELMADPTQGGKGWIAVDEAARDRAKGGAVPILVNTVTLDRMSADGVVDPERVGMLWIDAQGHEGQVLAGATALVERGVPIVLEWFPKMLDRVGKRRLIEDAVAAHYTHFLDLRPDPEPERPLYELQPGRTLSGYTQPFVEPDGPSFTDILALRLEDLDDEPVDVSELLPHPAG
jgi:FkbM family methyltransferase